MTLEEAFVLMDLLLDKADQPYFTNNEKSEFLRLSISDFINTNYQRMGSDEDARRALAPLTDWQGFNLTPSDIIGDKMTYDSSYPALSKKYQDDGVFAADGTVIANSTHTSGNESTSVGYFGFGNQYILPKQHLYVLSLSVAYFNIDYIIDPADGKIFAGRVKKDIVGGPMISAKNRSARDWYENRYGDDPFNKEEETSPHWMYMENRIVVAPERGIRYVNMQVITLPTVEEAFSSDVYGAGAPKRLVFAEHYQKQIVELAVSKMTKVDIGIMKI